MLDFTKILHLKNAYLVLLLLMSGCCVKAKDVVDFENSALVTVSINDAEHKLPAGITVIQACELVGVEIPRFCYHDRLEIAGNCRMCLVEIQPGPPKPQASCAINIAEGMKVKTNTAMVKKAREGVMEFLLANHPLDCPVCDQGGECDLQDQAFVYGKGDSRFDEKKRAVKDKDFGPLVKTEMTRCIHCTRCVRFVEDVAGTSEIGGFGRGNDMEISTYIDSAITSELSGNIIDLCPVGALTSKPYAFKARPWELKKTNSIDVMDAVGSAIRIDSKGNEVLRITPRINEEINEEWISDKTRFACDGLSVQRIDRCYARDASNKLKATDWDMAIDAVVQKLKFCKPDEIAFIAGKFTDLETIKAAKNLCDSFGVKSYDFRQSPLNINTSDRKNYLFNTTIGGLESATTLLIVNSNPRIEAPIINARIRKAVTKFGLKVAYIGVKPVSFGGENFDLNYKYDYISEDKAVLNDILNGTHPYAKVLEGSKYPALILGEDALSGVDGIDIHNICLEIAKKYMNKNENGSSWNGFNMLHKWASNVGALDFGFICNEGVDGILKGVESGRIKFVYLLGADEIEVSRLNGAFVVYHGTHGDVSAGIANVVLPAATYTEKVATFVNVEGVYQHTSQAIPYCGDGVPEVVAISKIIESLKLKTRDNLTQKPSYAPVDTDVKLLSGKFVAIKQNFYMTDFISRNSKTMAKCTEQILRGKLA